MTVVTAPRRLLKLRRAQGESAPLPVEELHYGCNGHNGASHAGRGRCPWCGELLKSYTVNSGCEGCWVGRNWRRWLFGQSLAARRHVHEGDVEVDERRRLRGAACRARRRDGNGRLLPECS
jgi:hypothetical protein